MRQFEFSGRGDFCLDTRSFITFCDKASETFEPDKRILSFKSARSTKINKNTASIAVFLFISGRDCFINGILHPLQIPDAHEISGNSSQKAQFSATKTPFP